MNSNRSIKSNASLGGRSSPTFPNTRSDHLINRVSSPSSSVFNSRSSLPRQQDRGKFEFSSKTEFSPKNEFSSKNEFSPKNEFSSRNEFSPKNEFSSRNDFSSKNEFSARNGFSSKNEFSSKNFSAADDLKFHKAAFQRCADKPAGIYIIARGKFIQALNYVGYDIPKETIDQLWEDNSEEISFKVFQDILKNQKPTDSRALEEAFEKLYKDRKPEWNKVDYDRFRTDLIGKGDRLSEDEFQKIRLLLGTESGKVDVKKLIKVIEDNKTSCRQKILREQEEDTELLSKPPGSPRMTIKNNDNCNVRIFIDSTSKKPFSLPKTRSLQTKGAFFCEYSNTPDNAMYFSIGYTFEIKKPTSISITLEPTISRYHKDSSFKNLDVRILLFEKNPRFNERHLLHMSSERSGTKSYLQVEELAKGSYEIIPVTFGGVLRARSQEINDRSPTKTLRETKRGKYLMSEDYRQALEYVFDIFDFDDNKQLDRQEYNLWTLRTTGEEITDNDWSSIREAVDLDVDENISKDKFLKLNDMEVQEPDTSEEDLWIGLKSLGFNYALELDMMCPFNLTLYTNQFDVTLKPASCVDFAEIKKILIKFLQNKGDKIKLDDPLIRCFNYQDNCGSILYAENKNSFNVRLSIDVKKSNNAALNLKNDPRKPTAINIRRDTTQFLWFAHKLDSQEQMEVNAIVQVQ